MQIRIEKWGKRHKENNIYTGNENEKYCNYRKVQVVKHTAQATDAVEGLFA